MTQQQNDKPSLSVAAREYHELRDALERHEKAAAQEANRLRSEMTKRQEILKLSSAGIDHDKVALARTVVYAWDHRNGGADWQGCRADAIKQLATGRPLRLHYGDLWAYRFGTKNYDRWRGQREDHEYGYGPRHGSMCFEIGVTNEARRRGQANLSPDEVEAAIYFLVNLERIQLAEEAAKVAAQ